MERCRYCTDKLQQTETGAWWALTGLPCLAGHEHEPWPNLIYVEQEGMPGISIMRLISRASVN